MRSLLEAPAPCGDLLLMMMMTEGILEALRRRRGVRAGPPNGARTRSDWIRSGRGQGILANRDAHTTHAAEPAPQQDDVTIVAMALAKSAEDMP